MMDGTMMELFGSDVEIDRQVETEKVVEYKSSDSKSEKSEKSEGSSKWSGGNRRSGRSEVLDIRRNSKALKTLKTLQNMAHIAGFNIVESLTLQDTETGLQWALNGK